MKTFIPQTFLLHLIIIISFTAYTQNTSIDLLQKVLQTQRSDINKVNTLIRISFAYRNGNADSGLYYGEKALKLAESLQWKGGMAMANKLIGNYHYTIGDALSAKNYFQKALKLNEEEGNKVGMANNLGLLGTAYLNLSDYIKALEYAQKALKLSEQIKYNAAIIVIIIFLAFYMKTWVNIINLLKFS